MHKVAQNSCFVLISKDLYDHTDLKCKYFSSENSEFWEIRFNVYNDDYNKFLFYGTVNINFNSFVELGRITQTFAISFYCDINNISAPFRYQANIEIWD